MNDTYESLLDNIVQFNSDDMLCLPSANSIIELMALIHTLYMGRAKRICVFEHSVMTNFNCACPVIQRGQGSGFLSEGSS